MTSHEIQLLILRALRFGPLNHFEIAVEIDQAPFRVRAELHRLKAERYVTERVAPDDHSWKLTERGYRVASQQDQLELH